MNTGESNGPGLLEIYEATDSRKGLANLSLRARTGPGHETATAGFVLHDYAGFGRPARVLLRAVGPGLSEFGVEETLPNPELVLMSAAGEVLRRAETWHQEDDAAQIRYVSPIVGAFPLAETATDAAMLIELAPGAYTMSASSAEQSSGVVLLEIYLVP